MILNTLGETIDIHGGGRDLLFPHHENELAQSESLTDKPFSKYWSHCGLVKINGEKMSKSLGNSLSIRDALNKYNYEVIKYVMFSKHYSSDIDIHDSDFQIADGHMYYFYSTIREMEEFIKNNNGNGTSEILEDEIPNTIITRFIDAMDDDFNSAVALSNLHVFFKYANNLMKTAKKTNKQIIANTLDKALKDLKSVYKILGLFEQNPNEFILKMKEKYLKKLNIDEKYIEEQISKRTEAKKNRDFEIADNIRSELDEKGIILNDTKEGTVWDIKALYSSN